MLHLKCSEAVQQSSTLPWIYPDIIDLKLVTLIKTIKNILKDEDLGTMPNNKGMFPIFFISSEIISSRQFIKRYSLLDLPITATLTR